MKKCFICGDKARIFTGEEWICEECYLDLREENEEHRAAGVEPFFPKEKHIDLNLSKV